MGLLDELKRALGIDEVDGPPEAPGPTEERTAKLRELGLEPPEPPIMVDPPPERWNAGYVDKAGQVQPAENSASAKILAEASQMLKERSGQGAGVGRHLSPAREPAVASAAERTAPPESEGKAELLLAMKNASKPPEDQGEEPNPTPGQQIHPEPTSSTGADKPPVANGLPPPPTPPPEHDATSGGPLGAVSRMVMGAGGDPRTQRLREALERSGHMKRLAGHITGMGIGADIARGDGYRRADQGKNLSDRADDEVRDATLPTQFEQKNARFDTEQARAAQDMRLRDTGEARAQQGELRAEAGDRRATAGEARQQKGFETTQGKFDKTSETSANARASIESLYPAAWKRIPEEIRNNFSAADVERIFGEVKPVGTGPSKQSGIDNRQARAMAAKAKLSDPGMVIAMNDVLATLDSGSAPGAGYFMNADGWQNFLRTQAGKEFRQAIFSVVNPHIHETHGATVTDSELPRALAKYGYGEFDDPASLAAGMRRLGAEIEAKQNQKLNQLPPEAKKLLTDQGAVEHVDSKRGRVLKGDITTEEQLKDTMDFPEGLKPYIGILGAAKKWLSGSGKKPPSRSTPADVLDDVL